MFLLIDNHDSFTANLVQAFCKLGREPLVLKNDDLRLLELAESPDLRMVCLSPGPGRPENAGFCLEFLSHINPKVPVLGVGLGHQVLGLFAGAEPLQRRQFRGLGRGHLYPYPTIRARPRYL